MKFGTWRVWYLKQPVLFKIYIWLILLRPLIDSFYYFKHFSPLASPPYIAGILSLILFIVSVFRYPVVNRGTPIDRSYQVLFTLTCIGMLIFISRNISSIETYRTALRTLSPLLLFFFYRRLIRSSEDLDGILVTFLYSSIFVLGIVSYELIINPIKVVTSRGLERMEGSFADVMNYSIYINMSCLISAYFLTRKQSKWSHQFRIILFITIVAISLLLIPRLNHLATMGVLGFLIISYFLFSLRISIFKSMIIIGFGILIFNFFGESIYESTIMPLIKTDTEVYSGDKDQSQALHGRVGRWERMWTEFSEKSILYQYFGLSYSPDIKSDLLFGGTHNDFLRVTFTTGYIGLSVYLILLFNLLIRIPDFRPAYMYLIFGAVGSVILYSISTPLTLYMPLMNVICAVYALVCLPKKLIKNYF